MGCGWWIKIRSVSDKTVNFYIGIPGNSWSTVLKDSSGAVEASTGGSSYGDHSLTATSYGPHTLELTCNWNISNPCEVCSVNIPQPTGIVSFISSPPGAEIFVDGADQGVMTPNTAINVPAGDHAYVLRLAGYNDYSGTVSVVSGQTASVSVTLTPTCVPAWNCELPLNGYETDGCGNGRANPACNPPQTGNISFVSTPAGAGIFLDGNDQGAITPNTVSGIPAGIHAYTLKLAGYNDGTGTVSVISGQTAPVTVTMIASCTPVWKCEIPLSGIETDGCGNKRVNPACNPPQTGSIGFTSTPPGAEIFIDGAYQGLKTPAIISDIPVGTHTYTLKQTGYNDVTGTANVGLNQIAVASSTLIPVARPGGIGMGTIMGLGLLAGLLGTVIIRSKGGTTIVTRPSGR